MCVSDNDLIECERVNLDYFNRAPVRVEAAEVIAASPKRIFDVFLDADSWSRWAWPITGVDWTSPMPLEVGSTRTVWMRGPMVGYEEFIAWEPGRRMAFRFNQTIKGGPSPRRCRCRRRASCRRPSPRTTWSPTCGMAVRWWSGRWR